MSGTWPHPEVVLEHGHSPADLTSPAVSGFSTTYRATQGSASHFGLEAARLMARSNCRKASPSFVRWQAKPLNAI
ncbi:MAG: hypothetical protein LC130_22445 [Bryobacterales bacterium]|nr:hypothetical protein [Bryobacterales bacterium]